MKKPLVFSIIASALSLSSASAAESLTIGSAADANATTYDSTVTNGSDITEQNQYGYSPILWTNSDRFKIADSTLLTEGSTAYSLHLDVSFSAYNFSIGSAVYVDTFTIKNGDTNNLTNLTINFGENGSLTASSIFNIGVGFKTEGSLFTIKATGNTTESLSRVLVSASEFWNVSDANEIAVDISGMDGLTNLGIVDSADRISEGQYGIVRTGSSLTLVSKVASVPESTTASLSLLALSALALRRRRA